MPANEKLDRRNQHDVDNAHNQNRTADRSGGAPGKSSRSHSRYGRVIQAKGDGSANAPRQFSDFPTSGGTPMPKATREKFEAAFCTDFSSVRVHEGDAAPQMGAVAFTQGEQIHFAPGKYDPVSGGGQELLGHELTHVLQQRSGSVTTQGKDANINKDQGLEAEADALGARAARGELVQVGGVANIGPIQRVAQAPGEHANDTEAYRDELYERARLVAPTFYGLVHVLAKQTYGEALCPIEVIAPILKSIARAEEKTEEDNGGDYSKLVDLVRATVVYERIGQAVAAAKRLDSGRRISLEGMSFDWEGQVAGGTLDFHSERHKDRSQKMVHDHLINITLKMPDGMTHVCELQLHVKDVMDYKNQDGGGHDQYDIVRDPNASAEDKNRAMDKMSSGYAAANKKAGGAAASGQRHPHDKRY